MDLLKIKTLVQHVSFAAIGGVLLFVSDISFAAKPASYTLSGPCAFLPAARATEFHGNAGTSKLNLAMAGNQWVVAPEAIQAFNVYIGKGDGTEPAYRSNPGWDLASLNENANRLYMQYIPPGQLVKQISSGCMTLGNDEERNMLPGNVQVDFDVFSSTNYTLMRQLAAKGFVSEAVPYIKNRLDLMVYNGNPAGIGSTSYGTGDSEFDTQFDIIMDLLSGDIVASSLDHVNEGIHKASNGYMINAHKWILENDQPVTIALYNDANGDPHSGTKMASEWIQIALAPVATPMPGSPGARRLADSGDSLAGDAGDKHSNIPDPVTGKVKNHDLDKNGCGAPGALLFCEFAVLNKSNTHESRVHHVETPNGVLPNAAANGYVPVDVGFVWITELAYQVNHGNTDVTGMSGNVIANGLGIPKPTTGTPQAKKVNSDKTYSLALLATSKHAKRGQLFIDFLRAPEGQLVYTNGGFTGLSTSELAASEVYDCDGDGVADEVMEVSGVNEAQPQTCL